MRHIPACALAALLCTSVYAQDADPSTGVLQPATPPKFGPNLIPVSSTASAFTVFTNVPGHPTAQIPGLTGFEFDAGTGTTHFDRPFGSPNGNWILTAVSNDPSTSADEVLLVNGVAVLKEGDPAAWSAGNVLGPFDQGVGINDLGEYVFSMNIGPTTVNDDFVIHVTNSGTTFNVVAQEGSPVPALTGSTYDDTIDNAIITSVSVGLSADGIDGGSVTTTTDETLELGGALVAQEGVTVPTGQAGGASNAAENFSLGGFWADASGANTLWTGDLLGSTSTDQVLVVNNAVMLQEGSVIPGSGFTDPIDSSGIIGEHMDFAGNWFARGNNDVSEQDWVVRNGVVIATLGQPAFTGSSEAWSDTEFADCFFAHIGNGNGDWVIGGVTDGAATANGVLVFNGQQVVAREGDPIDLDNDGAFDDGVYFNTFGNDDLYLSNANDLYFTATFRDAAGTLQGQGVFRASIAGCTGGEVLAYGSGCTGSTTTPPRLNAIGCSTPGGSLTLTITEGLPNSTALLLLGVQQLAAPIAGGCTLLVNPLVTLAVPLDAAGSLTVPTVIPPGTPTGITAFLQVFNLDAGVFWGYSNSNGLEVNIQ